MLLLRAQMYTAHIDLTTSIHEKCWDPHVPHTLTHSDEKQSVKKSSSEPQHAEWFSVGTLLPHDAGLRSALFYFPLFDDRVWFV